MAGRILHPIEPTKEIPMTATETKTPRKRGEGPLSVRYMNDGATEASEALTFPVAVIYKANGSGEEHTVDLKSLSNETILTLAAQMLNKHIETYVRNHLTDEGATVHSLTVKRAKEISEGRVVARAANGTKAVKVVDVSPWVDAYELMLKKLKKTVSEHDLGLFRTKLLNMTGVERNKFILSMKGKHPHYKQATLEVAAKMAAIKSKAIKEVTNFDDFLV